MSATEFEAKCLALLDEIHDGGGTITVTKRGRPMATLAPVPKRRVKSTEGAWRGKVRFPERRLLAGMADLWEVVQDGNR